jgi:D-threo-aldose 1-dehydrogenase
MRLPTRKLGRTGLEVTVLGFGAAPLGDIYEVLDDATAIATVEAAADAGVTLFDAAPLYGQGSAEHRVGTALRRRPPGSFVMSTKVGRLLTPAPHGRTKTTRYVGGLSFNVVHDYSYDGAMRSHEQSLHRLGLPKVDILLIHDADAWSHGPVEGPKRYREAIEGAYKALEKLRSEKVIKGIGIGVNDPIYAARYLREGDFDCLLLAGRYTLLEQPALKEVLPIAAERDIGVMLGGVFNSGILARGSAAGAKYNYTDAPPDTWTACARSNTCAPIITWRCRSLRCTSRSRVPRCRALCSVPSHLTRCAAMWRPSQPKCRPHCGPTSRPRVCSTPPRRRLPSAP